MWMPPQAGASMTLSGSHITLVVPWWYWEMWPPCMVARPPPGHGAGGGGFCLGGIWVPGGTSEDLGHGGSPQGVLWDWQWLWEDGGAPARTWGCWWGDEGPPHPKWEIPQGLGHSQTCVCVPKEGTWPWGLQTPPRTGSALKWFMRTSPGAVTGCGIRGGGFTVVGLSTPRSGSVSPGGAQCGAGGSPGAP